MSYLRLTIEPIPAGSRLAILAKLLPSGQWSRIRHEVYRKAGFRCQICGHEGQLHCHELWQYNEQSWHQWLQGFQTLCSDCHAVKHLLFTRDDHLRARLMSYFRETIPVIARRLGCGADTVVRVRRLYRNGGINALYPIKPPGRPCRATPEFLRQMSIAGQTNSLKLGYGFST